MEPKKESGALLLVVIVLVFGMMSTGESEGLNPSPQSTPTPTPYFIPSGVIEDVWNDIMIGVQAARGNGVECDPVLLYAIKVVETGENYCDEAWEEVERPNACASQEDVLGMYQFLNETFQRNAERYNVQGSVWDPKISSEVACYFIHDEAHISLTQTQEEFLEEFAHKGYIWNKYEQEALQIYEIGIYLTNQLKE
ncbi:hypothetical protein GX618_01620 [Candidatus Dojkabacteria bacterium]|jgi:hypothetical protein|uniref:Transglycosylase SLT domain-containing protein n=1 Tax=Candidatus Dojkabacteria bacterium TaxID=2099670 RepID=A0A847ESJ8_9BACT|nr:hypothetical protein [Candidatus Dojkabacteria bacterium]